MNTNSFPSWTPTQPSVSGAGQGGAAAFARGGGGGGGMSGGGAFGGYGGSGEIGPEQRQNLNELKSDNKNKLASTIDMSGNAGNRGASFNFGTQANPIVSAGGGSSTMIWVIAGAGLLGIIGIIFLRRKS